MTNAFVEHVVEQLEAYGSVETRRMFGGWGIYRDGLFFALIAEDRLFFKVDDSNRADFEKSGAEPFRPFADKPASTGYFEVPEAVLENRTRLAEWARKAVEVARCAKR